MKAMLARQASEQAVIVKRLTESELSKHWTAFEMLLSDAHATTQSILAEDRKVRQLERAAEQDTLRAMIESLAERLANDQKATRRAIRGGKFQSVLVGSIAAAAVTAGLILILISTL